MYGLKLSDLSMSSRLCATELSSSTMSTRTWHPASVENRVFRLGVKEVLPCDPVAGGNSPRDESADGETSGDLSGTHGRCDWHTRRTVERRDRQITAGSCRWSARRGSSCS